MWRKYCNRRVYFARNTHGLAIDDCHHRATRSWITRLDFLGEPVEHDLFGVDLFTFDLPRGTVKGWRFMSAVIPSES